MNKEYQHHYSYEQLNWHMQKVFSKISWLDKKAIFKFDSNTNICKTWTDVLHPYGSFNYTPSIIVMGVKSLNQNQKDGYVRDDDFVKTIRKAYHELNHIRLRIQEYQRANPDQDIKKAARVTIAGRYFREYYEQGYRRDPEEIMCELYSFEQLEKHFEKYPVDIDWKQIVLNEANNMHFVTDKMQSYHNMIEQYKKALNDSYYKKRINGYVYEKASTNKKNNSKAFEELHKNGLLLEIVNAPNGVEEITLINNCIAKYHPEYFRGYQCIKSEYKVKNFQNAIETLSDKILRIKPAPEHKTNDDFEPDY